MNHFISVLGHRFQAFLQTYFKETELPPFGLDEEEWEVAQENMAKNALIAEARELVKPKNQKQS